MVPIVKTRGSGGGAERKPGKTFLMAERVSMISSVETGRPERRNNMTSAGKVSGRGVSHLGRRLPKKDT